MSGTRLRNETSYRNESRFHLRRENNEVDEPLSPFSSASENLIAALTRCYCISDTTGNDVHKQDQNKQTTDRNLANDGRMSTENSGTAIGEETSLCNQQFEQTFDQYNTDDIWKDLLEWSPISEERLEAQEIMREFWEETYGNSLLIPLEEEYSEKYDENDDNCLDFPENKYKKGKKKRKRNKQSAARKRRRRNKILLADMARKYGEVKVIFGNDEENSHATGHIGNSSGKQKRRQRQKAKRALLAWYRQMERDSKPDSDQKEWGTHSAQ